MCQVSAAVELGSQRICNLNASICLRCLSKMSVDKAWSFCYFMRNKALVKNFISCGENGQLVYKLEFWDEAKKSCRLVGEIEYDKYRINIGSKWNRHIDDVFSFDL